MVILLVHQLLQSLLHLGFCRKNLPHFLIAVVIAVQPMSVQGPHLELPCFAEFSLYAFSSLGALSGAAAPPNLDTPGRGRRRWKGPKGQWKPISWCQNYVASRGNKPSKTGVIL
uniref:AP2/ERF domain-containing protein n=1 Tax=Salix viminalis TaxID=40686 RepID=A0A6N2K9B1_SALVM